MSGYVSPFPAANALFGESSARQRQYATNDLMSQQTIGAGDNEVAARIAQGLVNLNDEAKAAELYPVLIREQQGRGFLKNAPLVWPGIEKARAVAALGVSAEKQYERQGVATDAAGVDLGGRGGGGVGGAGPGAAPPVPGYGGARNQAVMPPEYEPYFLEASRQTGIPVEVLKAQATQESGFNPNATGAAGEIGIMQIHPNTAANPGYGLQGVSPGALRDPRANILFGAQYLKARGGGGDFSTPAWQAAALRAYNGGGDPNYVANVFRYIPGGTQTAAAAPVAPAGGGRPPSGVQMGGAPPGPPGATQRPYVGGGFGTALNPVAPVVQVPPAPGGGTASNVPGNVNAMLGGMAQAQNTPVAGVQTAGPGAPTGGAQVASVELPPQPGWGTAVGSYGDGAAAAPPVVSPAAPVAPATTQQPPPAASRPTEMPAELRTNEAGLTPRDVEEFDRRRKTLGNKAEYQQWLNDLEQRRSYNTGRQDKWQATQQQASENQRQRENDERLLRQEQQRLTQQATTNKLADEKWQADQAETLRKITNEKLTLEQQGREEKAKEKTAELEQQKFKFLQANTLRDEATKITETFRPVQEAYERIEEAAKAQNSLGDLALIYTYTRLLDPATVHEEEVKRGMKAGGMGEYVSGWIARVTKGESLTPAVRQQFAEMGRRFYDVRKKGYDQELGVFRNLAGKYGLDPDTVAVSVARAQAKTETLYDNTGKVITK